MNNLVKKIVNRKCKRAETLVEVIIAIFIVLIGSGTATVLIISSMQANSFNRDNLIAMNLAVEGIEAVRNIRDTNWIKYSYDKDKCWNMQPESGYEECKDEKLISQGNYTLDLDPSNYSWSLTKQAGEGSNNLDLNDNALSTSNEEYKLYYVDVDSTVDSDSDTDVANDRDLILSKESLEFLTFGGSKMKEVSPTHFYRMISISYLDDDDEDENTKNIMKVEVLVQWKTFFPVHQVQLTTFLTNFNRVKID